MYSNADLGLKKNIFILLMLLILVICYLCYSCAP